MKKNFESANYENAIECDKIFLGWMSKSWIEKDTTEAREWHKRVTKESAQFAVDSWEERNLELNSEKNKIVS